MGIYYSASIMPPVLSVTSTFILVVIYLPSHSGTDTQQFRDRIQGYEFGSLRYLYHLDVISDTPVIRSITPDPHVPGNYIVVSRCVLYTYNPQSNQLDHLGGKEGDCRFKEGKNPRYSVITNVIESPDNASHLWVVDSGNSCIRSFNRLLNISVRFMHYCGRQEQNVPAGRIGTPAFLRLHKTDCNEHDCLEYYFYDKLDRKIKRLYYFTENPPFNLWYVSIWKNWGLDVRGLTFDPTGKYMYLSYPMSMERMEMATGQTEFLIRHSDEGYADGTFEDASASILTDMTFINDDLLLIADYTNSILRVLDMKSKTVSSICVRQTEFSELYRSGSYDSCYMRKPRSLTVSAEDDGKIYIVTSTDIYMLSVPKITTSTKSTTSTTTPTTTPTTTATTTTKPTTTKTTTKLTRTSSKATVVTTIENTTSEPTTKSKPITKTIATSAYLESTAFLNTTEDSNVTDVAGEISDSSFLNSSYFYPAIAIGSLLFIVAIVLLANRSNRTHHRRPLSMGSSRSWNRRAGSASLSSRGSHKHRSSRSKSRRSSRKT